MLSEINQKDKSCVIALTRGPWGSQTPRRRRADGGRQGGAWGHGKTVLHGDRVSVPHDGKTCGNVRTITWTYLTPRSWKLGKGSDGKFYVVLTLPELKIKSGRLIALTLYFFKMVLALSVLLPSHKHFIIILSIYTKKSCWDQRA